MPNFIDLVLYGTFLIEGKYRLHTALTLYQCQNEVLMGSKTILCKLMGLPKPMLTVPMKYACRFNTASRLDNMDEKIKRAELNKRAGWKKVHK